MNPTNVFVTYDGRVKLIDFGLAKAEGRLSQSGEGVVKGKVPYLSPEQIDESPIDHRTDIYALGATLWEMTTGRRLFKRDNDVETIKAIRAQEIPDPRTIVDGIYPDALFHIVDKALKRDPKDRYDSGAEMAAELDAFVLKHGRKTPMADVLSGWLEELFPGERSKQELWLDKVTNIKTKTRMTMRPPAPLAAVPADAPSVAIVEAESEPEPEVPAGAVRQPGLAATLQSAESLLQPQPARKIPEPELVSPPKVEPPKVEPPEGGAAQGGAGKGRGACSRFCPKAGYGPLARGTGQGQAGAPEEGAREGARRADGGQGRGSGRAPQEHRPGRPGVRPDDRGPRCDRLVPEDPALLARHPAKRVSSAAAWRSDR